MTTEFAEGALDVAEAMDTDLAEQVVSFTYRTVDQTDYASRGIRSPVDWREADGETVFVTSSQWFILKHELPVIPTVDDSIIIGTEKHRVGRVSPIDEVIGWTVYTSR